MVVSLGRNILGRVAVHSSVLGTQPFGEGPTLAARLAPYRFQLQSVTHSRSVLDAPIVNSGSLVKLLDLEWCMVATDGSVKGERLGAAVVSGTPRWGSFIKPLWGAGL